MKKKIYKPFNIEIKSVDEDKREITAIGSQQKVDRDGDIVNVDGIDFKSYKKNPIVLWSHRHSDPPIGKTERVWKDGKNLMFKINYADAETYSFADTIYKLTKGGYINAFSIGFSPDWEAAEPNEKTHGYTFNKTELLEISAVNVPANAQALVQSKSIQKALEDEVIDEVELKEMELILKELQPTAEDLGISEEDFISAKAVADESAIDEDQEPEEDQEQTINANACPKCGREYIQKEVDNDPFEWLFKEHQAPEPKDETNEDLVDELLKTFNGDS